MKPLILSAIAGAIVASIPLVAAEPADPVAIAPTPKTGSEEWSKGDYATGNWGGLRQRLDDAGIHFFAFYTNDPAGNVTGGKRRGVTYVDD